MRRCAQRAVELPWSRGAALALVVAVGLASGWLWGQGVPALPTDPGADGAMTNEEPAGGELDAAVERRIPVPANTGEVSFSFRAGDSAAGLPLTLVWDDGKQTSLRLRTGAASFTAASKEPGAPAGSTVARSLPDACLEIPEWKTRYFVRPNPDFYNEGEQTRLRSRWAALPGATDHLFHLSLQITSAGVDLSLDGNYVGRARGTGRLKEVAFPLLTGTEAKCLPAAPWTAWSCLDLRTLNRPGNLKNAVLDVSPDALKAQGIPLRLEPGGANADVGGVRDVSPPVDIDSCIYRYHERSAFAGLPEALLLSVPVAPYTRAWVLCATEDDPAKEPAFNVRLTRYRPGGIGNAMITSRVDVPRKVEAARATPACVGSVTYSSKNGETTVPLWLAPVPLNTSEIQDVLYSDWAEGRLDFELLGLVRNSASGVHVFAVTLERSPVAMEVKQVIPGSVFHNAEQPKMRVALRPLTAATVALQWEVEDVWGKKVTTGKHQHTFPGTEAPAEVPVSLVMADPGWYRVVFSLHDAEGRRLLAHPAAFAQLPPDTRRAGYESPFGCWWQQYLHSHITDPKIIGPLLFKAGLRRTTATCVSEEAMKPWQVTIDMIPWVMGYRPPDAPALSPAEWVKEYEGKVREYAARFPHSKFAMIFHESYDSSMAPEAWGGEPEPLVATGHIEKAKLASALLRQKFPELKIIVGNSGWSGALLSQLLRGGVPPNQIDALGMERLLGYFAKDTMPPERHEASWTLRQTALKYGCQAPPSDCYESGGRGNYGMSQGQIAKYVVRDSLVGLAWGYPYIGVGVISENVNGYYHTRWGGDALLRRTPLLYPQPQYVAIATMTRVLDSVKLLRRVPTGSHTAYALEFARGDERVYALWTPRGTCELRLAFAPGATAVVTGLYGQSRPGAVVNGELLVAASDEVTYVTATTAATAITAGKRSFPLDQPSGQTVVVAPLATPAGWHLTNSKAVECGPFPYRWLPWRTTGKGKLGAATDPDRGPCLSLELVAEGNVTELLSECLTLQATTPVPVPGKPSTLGVWVKGNSSWGRVMFEIMDAEGERFRGGASTQEPWGATYLDFDGWCFVALPLSDQSPVRSRLYYNTASQWTNNGGNGAIDYPIRVTGLIVEMKRKALDLADMAPVDSTILLRDLSACGAAEDMPQAPGAAPDPAGAGDGPNDDGTLLYQDGDLRYAKLGARPPGFSGGCILKEEDGRRFVAGEQGMKGLLANPRYYGAQNWLDYEWSFRFRFPVKDQVGFTCTIRTGIEASPFNLMKLPSLGVDDACRGIALEYSAAGFTPTVLAGMFELAPGSPWTASGLPPLAAGRWYRTVIRAAGRALDVYLEHDGKLVRVYRGPIPAGGGGFSLTSMHPLDVADTVIRQVTATPEDWSHAGRIRIEEGSPVAGTTCWRIEGPFLVSSALAVTPGRPCILSAYVRADVPDLSAIMIAGGKTKSVRATKDWTRYSFLALPQFLSPEDSRTLFALKGCAGGPIWIAAPQVEYAPPDPDAKRAADWTRTMTQDYEVDDKIAHRGQRSIRSLRADGRLALQEGELAAEDSRPLLLGGWSRADGNVKNAKLKVELYRDRKYWTPRTPGEEEPHETFVVDLRPAARGWEAAAVKIAPKTTYKRYRLSVLADSAAGTVWVDDLVLRPLGAARATITSDGLGGEDTEVGGNDLDDLAALGLLENSTDAKDNLLRNPGFEAPHPGGIVTLKCDRPSSAGPTNAPGSWLKAAVAGSAPP